MDGHVFPVCQFSDVVSPKSKNRLCLLNKKRQFVPLATCLACPVHKESWELFPICQPPKQPMRGLGDVVAAATTAVGIKPCGACKERQAVMNRAIPFKPALPALAALTGPANLMWFVYPRRETSHVWLAQQARIRESLLRFDGRKLLAIAWDDSTAQEEIDRNGWDEVVELPNDREQWELPGWRWAMERLAGDLGFTVRLHAKGVNRGTIEQHLVRWWQLAYEQLLDVNAVRESLQTSPITGVFRRNVHAGNLGVPWHYAGSMYAFRNELAGREPPGKVAASHYVEAWPALVASREEAGCLAYDGVGDLYVAKNWRGVATAPAPQAKPAATLVPLKVPEPKDIIRRVPNPAVSIVVPAWNEATRIETCLRALQAQTFGDFECFIVDDGSTDETPSVVKRLIGDDPRFSYIRKSHSGIGDTLNRGFDLCRAPLLTWASADSWMYPEFLAKLKAALDANPDKVLAYSDWEEVNDASGVKQTVIEPVNTRKTLQAGCRMGVCWLFRADAKAKAGPYVNDPCEDYYMHLMLSGVGDFIKVSGVLGAWRNHQANLTNRVSVPTRWASTSVVKAKARWQQAKYRVAYLCPVLDAASVGWLHMNAVNDVSDTFAIRHILGNETNVTPGIDARLRAKINDAPLSDEATQILTECDAVHVNNHYPDCTPDVYALIKDKPTVIHMHAGRYQWDTARLRTWKERGVPVLTCTPGHALARWMPNVMPVGHPLPITGQQYYAPIARKNAKLKFLCHHNYRGGKGIGQLEDILDGIREMFFKGQAGYMDTSVTTEKQLRLYDHLELKQSFDVTFDTLTHGYCGMATWEAMAMAQAVLCRMDGPTVDEYTRFFGSVPPINNVRTPDDVTSALVPMIRNRAFAVEAGQRNRAWILENYATEKILPLYEAIYTEAIHGRV